MLFDAPRDKSMASIHYFPAFDLHVTFITMNLLQYVNYFVDRILEFARAGKDEKIHSRSFRTFEWNF